MNERAPPPTVVLPIGWSLVPPHLVPRHVGARAGAVALRDPFHGEHFDVSALHLAALIGDLVAVQTAIARSTQSQLDASWETSTNCTPLLYAAAAGQLGVVQFLIERPVVVRVFFCDHGGLNPLHWAVKCSNAARHGGRSEERHGSDGQFLAVVQCLVRHGFSQLTSPDRAAGDKSTSTTALHLASAFGSVDVVSFLAGEVGRKKINRCRNYAQATPVHSAAEYGRCDVIRCLAAHGANVGLANHVGATALHIAVEKDHAGTIRTLRELGADLEAPNRFQATALHIAAGLGHLRSINALLLEGSMVDARNRVAATPLFLVVAEGAVPDSTTDAIIARLLEAGADVSCVNSSDTGVLYFAAKLKKLRCVRRLVAAGADVTDVDDVANPGAAILAVIQQATENWHCPFLMD